MTGPHNYAALTSEANKAARRAKKARQVAYLQAVIRHGSQKDAAAELGVSVQHVKNTLGDLYTRLEVNSLPEAVYALWLRELWGEG